MSSLLLSPPAAVAQQAPGVIVGSVRDASGRALAGASLEVTGTAYRAVSDRQGEFRLANLPAGTVLVRARYIGYQPVSASVTVAAGATVPLAFVLRESVKELAEITAEGQVLGQAQALNVQKTADNLVNVVDAELVGRLPDQNVAEALARVPGVAITRDQGEGRFVLIRGTPANLTGVSINGDRVATPEQNQRQVPLDVIPVGQVAALQVSKTLTPDMDADAIGGSVNLVTRTAISSKWQFDAAAAGGRNDLTSEPIWNVTGNAGRRFGANDRFGLIVGGTYYETGRGSQNIEPNWCFQNPGSCRGVAAADELNTLAELDIRDYPQVNRSRYGFNGTFDVRFSPESEVEFRAAYSRFSDDEVRQRNRVRFDNGTFTPTGPATGTVAGGRLERQTRLRRVNQDLLNLQLAGRHPLAGGQLDWAAGYSEAKEDRPGVSTITWRQNGIGFGYDFSNPELPSYTVTAGSETDASLFPYNSLVREQRFVRDGAYSTRANLTIPFRLGDGVGAFKVGVLGRFRNRESIQVNRTLAGFASNGATLAGVATPLPNNIPLNIFSVAPPRDIVLGGAARTYTTGPFADAARMQELVDSYLNRFAVNAQASRLSSDANTWTAGEDVYAAYVMTTLDFGKLRIIPGVRYEGTRVATLGNRVTATASTPTTGAVNFDNFFPSLTARYQLSEGTNLRFAATTSLFRPNFYDLVPYINIPAGQPGVTLGNPALRPARAQNLDLLAEHYFTNVGVISGGFFYKRIDDFIFPATVPLAAGNTEFGPDARFLTTPTNGDRAEVYGFEAAWQQSLSFLPGFLSGLGVNANYTYAQSSATIPLRNNLQTTLPGQFRHSGNVGVFFDRGPVSLRVGGNFVGRYLDTVGIDAQNDRYYESRFQLDAAGSLRLTRQVTIFGEFLNLTNQPLRYTFGETTARLNQNEFYSFWGLVGARVGL
ncbi:MAG: TonB-dependent receptor [Gemmatimonadales bacterium]|nr:TonB-dependent receptor [Gemmatimonadales bacterium]